MTKDHPKFFCEYCGNEVKRNTKICPHCGRFFASIRCPSCGFTGSDEDFKKGCPTCGYAFKSNTVDNSKKNKKRSFFFHKKQKTYTDEESLPLWIYLLVGLLFLAIIIFLYLKR